MDLPKKIFFSTLVIFTAWGFWISGVLGKQGLYQAYKLSQVRNLLKLRTQALENEKERLSIQLKLLQSDSFTQEKAIREVLGFANDNELIIEFK